MQWGSQSVTCNETCRRKKNRWVAYEAERQATNEVIIWHTEMEKLRRAGGQAKRLHKQLVTRNREAAQQLGQYATYLSSPEGQKLLGSRTPTGQTIQAYRRQREPEIAKQLRRDLKEPGAVFERPTDLQNSAPGYNKHLIGPEPKHRTRIDQLLQEERAEAKRIATSKPTD
jgi:hypothetical protein